MLAEIIILIIALLFFILSIFLFNGKGAWLISGYNTLSKEEKKQYDEKKVCRAIGMLCTVCYIMLCIMAYMGYRVDSGLTDESYMFPLALIFLVIIMSTIFIVSKYIDTKAKK